MTTLPAGGAASGAGGAPPANAVPWPAALRGTTAVAVIEKAIRGNRLSHSLLLHAADLATIEAAALAIADRLLYPASDSLENGRTDTAPRRFPPGQHPDCFALRPAGKMRQISADATRDLIGRVQVSATLAPRKVAILHEVDRMNLPAANIFLKTLEEPPANTTLLLLTTRPYALLPTIRSRVLHFRFPFAATASDLDGWAAWLEDYRAWLDRMAPGVGDDKQVIADHIFTIYGLVARFGAVLAAGTAAEWNAHKHNLSVALDDDEQVAIETGIANGIRLRMFSDIERVTRDFARTRLLAGDEPTRSLFTTAIERMEHNARLLRLNLNESAALEDFLLTSLRLWGKR